MANVRIDNFSGDTVICFFNGREYTLADEERVTVDAAEKGEYELRVHRGRIPMETEDVHETQNMDISERMQNSEKSLHTQLDGIFKVEINSTKAVLTVNTKVRAKEKSGLDVLYSGYSLEVTGAKTDGGRQVFANEGIRKGFIRHQLKEAFVPAGFVSIFLLILGSIALHANIIGKTVNIGGRDFTYPWSIGLMALALGFAGYTAYVIIYSLTEAKKYKK